MPRGSSKALPVRYGTLLEEYSSLLLLCFPESSSGNREKILYSMWILTTQVPIYYCSKIGIC